MRAIISVFTILVLFSCSTSGMAYGQCSVEDILQPGGIEGKHLQWETKGYIEFKFSDWGDVPPFPEELEGPLWAAMNTWFGVAPEMRWDPSGYDALTSRITAGDAVNLVVDGQLVNFINEGFFGYYLITETRNGREYIVKFHIEINTFDYPIETWYTGTDGNTPPGMIDTYSVGLHAFGHVYGLRHPTSGTCDITDTIMAASMEGPGLGHLELGPIDLAAGDLLHNSYAGPEVTTFAVMEDGSRSPMPSTHSRTCPAGDFESIIVQIEFNANVYFEDIPRSAISLGPDPANEIYIFDEDQSAAWDIEPDPVRSWGVYHTEIGIASISGFGQTTIPVIVQGVEIENMAEINVRSIDFVLVGDSFGKVEIGDWSAFGQTYGFCVGDPYFNEQADFNNDGCVLIEDIQRFGSHFGHSHNVAKSGEYTDPSLVAKSTPAILNPNYPNPFNPSTTIEFSLTRPGEVTLAIFDIQGRLVKTLVDGFRPEGLHSEIWNGRDNQGSPVASGTYLYRMTTNNETMSKRMVLLK